ncbi:MAG: ATP-binding protein [Sideroxydans sp.]|nr:ATP-binding protein [Sideroxydans sp.]
MAYITPGLFIDRLGRQRGLLVAASLIAIIAVADYATGYAVRLSILYLVPIAMTAWLAGATMGIAAAALTSMLWMLSFQSENFYLNQGYYFWEAGVKLCSNLAFAWLIARLRLALSQADERFLRVLEEMRAAVYVADERRDQIVYANPEMLRIVGDTRAIAPSDFQKQFAKEQAHAEILFATQTGENFALDTFKNKRNGRWYLMREGTIPWGSNPDVKLRVLTDITERINAEQLREKHLAVMHQAAQLATLAEIATTLAHEINQPLMVIATYTEACQNLLGMPEIDRDEISMALVKCHNQAVRAASIIERLREFIRQRQHRPSLCDAHAMVEEALGIMRSSLDEARITVNADGVMPAIAFMADKLLIVQVLTNLIRNAIEAMRGMEPERRELSVGISLASREILFVVADRGSGLDASSRELAFAPFYSTKPSGLGLGLSICRSVAEAHGGRLWATDNPGGGTIFNLSLPIDTRADDAN